MGRVYMHLTYDQRLAIKQMLERGNSKKEIAESIGVHTSTIYREIDRGTVNGHYDPTAAEEAYQEKYGSFSYGFILIIRHRVPQLLFCW